MGYHFSNNLKLKTIFLKKPGLQMTTTLKSELKQVVKHVPVYTLGSVLSQLVGFLLLPIYTRYLTPADYGTLQLVVLTGDIISIVAGAKASEALMRFYFEPKTEEGRNTVASTCFITVAVLAACCLFPVAFVSNYLAEIILHNRDLGHLITLSLLTVFLNLLMGLVSGYIQIQNKSTLFLFVSLGKLLLNVTLNIYFVTIVHLGVLGVVLGTLISTALFSIFGVLYTLKIVGLNFSPFWSKKLFRYSLPLIPSTLANRMAHSSDRYFLNYYLSLSDVGIYSLAYRFGSLIHNVFNVALFRLLNVRIMAIYKEKDAPVIIARMATYSLFSLLFIGLGLSLFAKDLIMVMTEESYWHAADLMPAIVVCYIIFSLESFFVAPILFAQKTAKLAYANVLAGAINIGLNFVLIPRYGVNGAIMATFISFLQKIISIYFFGRKLYHIPYEWNKFAKLTALAITLYAAGYATVNFMLPIRLLSNLLLLLSFIWLLWIGKVLSEEEKEAVAVVWRTKIFSKFR